MIQIAVFASNLISAAFSGSLLASKYGLVGWWETAISSAMTLLVSETLALSSCDERNLHAAGVLCGIMAKTLVSLGIAGEREVSTKGKQGVGGSKGPLSNLEHQGRRYWYQGSLASYSFGP